MIINMTTFAGRKTHYIDRTLESLSQSDGRDLPINLIMGSSDTSHVEQYRTVANIVPWDPDSEELAKKADLRFSCTLNAIRALRYGDDEQCLCCEDDIRFRPNWFSQLMLTIAEIDRKDYVLSLSQGRGQVPDKRYVAHPGRDLIGAQAIFYSNKRLREAVADYVERNSAPPAMNDNLIGRYAKRYAALYNTCPILVGHIGQVSCFHSPLLR